MNRLTDDEIQKLLDAKMDIEPYAELDLYKTVYAELAKPIITENDSFAGDVVHTIQVRQDRKTTIKIYVAVAVCLLFFGFILMTGITLVDNKLLDSILHLIYRFKWAVLFILIITGLISAIEKRMRMRSGI